MAEADVASVVSSGKQETGRGGGDSKRGLRKQRQRSGSIPPSRSGGQRAILQASHIRHSPAVRTATVPESAWRERSACVPTMHKVPAKTPPPCWGNTGKSPAPVRGDLRGLWRLSPPCGWPIIAEEWNRVAQSCHTGNDRRGCREARAKVRLLPTDPPRSLNRRSRARWSPLAHTCCLSSWLTTQLGRLPPGSIRETLSHCFAEDCRGGWGGGPR